MSIVDKLATIANNTPEICANLFKSNTVSGSTVTVGDVRPIEHRLGVKVSSKNLLDLIKCKALSTNNYGFATEILEDDVIRIYGTFKPENMPSASWNFIQTLQTDISGKGYKIKAFIISGMENFKQMYGLRTENEKAIAIQCSVTQGTYYDMRFKLMVSVDTPAEYTTYISDFSDVNISRYGKNILSGLSLFGNTSDYLIEPIYLKKGDKFTFSFDGTYEQWRLMFFGTDINGTPFEKMDNFLSNCALYQF